MDFIKLQTLISLDRIANIVKYSDMVKNLEGDVAEFGVFRGGSLELIAQLNPNKNIIGIDSFEGLPAPTTHDNFHKQGDFKEVEYEAVYGYFKTLYRNVELLKGFSPSIFEQIHPYRKFSFVHIDVDLYQSVAEGLAYFYPRLVDGGVILLDDYGFESTEGAKRAVDEFVDAKGKESDLWATFSGELLYYLGGASHKQYLIIK